MAHARADALGPPAAETGRSVKIVRTRRPTLFVRNRNANRPWEYDTQLPRLKLSFRVAFFIVVFTRLTADTFYAGFYWSCIREGRVCKDEMRINARNCYGD